MRKHNNWLKGIVAPATGMLLLAGPLSSAFAVTVDGPGMVLMIDGSDSNVTVNIAAIDGTFPLGQYDFGFLTGSSYTMITGTVGSHTFNGGDIVDFALRDRGTDNLFGTGDDLIYGISNPADYANQIYSIPIDPSNSQNPVVSSTYYRSLILAWDLDLNGVTDAGFDIGVSTPLFTYDGVAPTVIPLPAAAWLFGSGLLGLGALMRRHRRQA
jgi:hypothetical protein